MTSDVILSACFAIYSMFIDVLVEPLHQSEVLFAGIEIVDGAASAWDSRRRTGKLNSPHCWLPPTFAFAFCWAFHYFGLSSGPNEIIDGCKNLLTGYILNLYVETLWD
jgi:hypothetical protein